MRAICWLKRLDKKLFFVILYARYKLGKEKGRQAQTKIGSILHKNDLLSFFIERWQDIKI